MPRRKKDEQHARIGEKDIWHPYELQSVVQRKFIVIVNRVLKGEYGILDRTHCATTIEI